MKPKFGRFGPLHNYTGAHVVLQFQGRTLLGEIVRVYRRECPPAIMAVVKHFNGQPWPTDAALVSLEILERNHQEPTEQPQGDSPQ